MMWTSKDFWYAIGVGCIVMSALQHSKVDVAWMVIGIAVLVRVLVAVVVENNL